MHSPDALTHTHDIMYACDNAIGFKACMRQLNDVAVH